MAVRLPSVSKVELPAEPKELIQRMRALIFDGTVKEGYLSVDTDSGKCVLFFLKGKTFCAGEIVEDRFIARSVTEFFGELPRAKRASYHPTDLPLFLCAAVLFRKAPSAHISTNLVDTEMLLKSVKESGKDGVLVVQRGEGRNLVFCKDGEPVALYAADEDFPKSGAIADRIVEYVFTGDGGSDVTLDLYYEIQLPPAADAGRPLADYSAATGPQKTGTTPVLLVRLGTRVVFQFPVTMDKFTVGRGSPNDLPLDNLSISRNHAVVRRKGEQLEFVDLGGENGLVFGGERVPTAMLKPGDEIQVGKYSLVYPRYTLKTNAPLPEFPSSSPRTTPIEATIAMSTGATHGVIEHNERTYPMKTPIFSIGKDRRSHIRITGFFVAPIHVQIGREEDGTYQIVHVDGRRALKLGGRVVEGALLSDGDEFSIGRHHFRFAAPSDQ